MLSGIVRDRDGFAVAGALVRVTSPAASTSAVTGDDGSFALERPPGRIALDVACRYCRPLHEGIDGPGPLIVVVDRAAALRDDGLGSDDLAALPYARASDAAGLLPFVVAGTSTISDRGLAQARGTIVVDGLPGYRALDGGSIAATLPAHAATGITRLPPTVADSVDDRSAGGVAAIDTLGPGDGRIDTGSSRDVVLRGGSAVRGGVALSSGDATRERLAAHAPLTFGADRLDVDVSSAREVLPGLAWSGASATYVHALRTGELAASLLDLASSDANGPENDRLVALRYASNGIAAGLLSRTASAGGSSGGRQFDDRIFVELRGRAGALDLHGALAFAREGTAGGTFASMRGGVLPVLDVGAALTPQWSLHAALVDAFVASPLSFSSADDPGLTRSHLLDAGLRFDDLRALRLEAIAFREQTDGGTSGALGGSGLAATWQIAPALSLRAWKLVSRQAAVPVPYDASPALRRTASGTIDDRDAIWLSAGRSWRIDAIARGGSLDGDVVAPLGNVRLVIGTTAKSGVRTVTIGLTLPAHV